MVNKRSGVTGPEDLDVARMLVTATETAGLDGYGDESFVEPLTILSDSIEAEGFLSRRGAMGVQAEVVSYLVNRLRFEADLQQHPEILDEDVSDPIVILGLARTGSTKLQRMLSADPSAQMLPLWRLMNPAPFPDADPDAPDPRIGVAEAQLARLVQECPEVAAAHPLAAKEADEEYFLLKLTFESMGNMWGARCPSYVKWWQSQPRERPYEYLRRLVQYLQWQDGGRRGPLVLKTPAHTGNPDIVLATFPNATLVQCHRDPSVALASSLRLQELSRRLASDCVDAHELGAFQLDYFAGEMARNLAQRELLSDDQQVTDVAFLDICNDPIGVIRDIYRRRGTELAPEGEASMIAWERKNPRHKDGAFRYALEDYGLTRDQVSAAFDPYLAQFGSAAS